MSMTTQLCALFCALLVAHASCAEEVLLPRSVQICNHDANDYSSCLKSAIQDSWLTFIKGIPELGLPALDPYERDVVQNNFVGGVVNGAFVLRDVKIYGLAKANFLAVKPYRSGKTMNMEIDLELPKIFIEGDYKAEAEVALYKLGGKGYFNVSLDGMNVTWALEGRIEDDRWVVDHFHLYPEVAKMQVYFSDVFDGNDELNKAAVSFVNSYWPIFYKGMMPTVEKIADYQLSDLVNRLIFSKISVSKTFP